MANIEQCLRMNLQIIQPQADLSLQFSRNLMIEIVEACSQTTKPNKKSTSLVDHLGVIVLNDYLIAIEYCFRYIAQNHQPLELFLQSRRILIGIKYFIGSYFSTLLHEYHLASNSSKINIILPLLKRLDYDEHLKFHFDHKNMKDYLQ